jgi:cysteine desulfurase
MDNKGLVYLDNAATTQVDPRIADALSKLMQTHLGNPSSRHALGLHAERAVRNARAAVAERFAVDKSRVFFTSGATEASALAILGTAAKQRAPGHVLVSSTEHPSVLDSAALLSKAGHEVERIPVDQDGVIDAKRLESMLRPETFLVAMMHVNNEVGTVQPVGRLALLVKRKNRRCRVLVDAVQSFGLLATKMDGLSADILVASGHKLHAPSGIGCLALKRGVSLAPIWGGGDQEQGLRPGTENVLGIVALGMAATLGRGDRQRLADGCRVLQEAVRAALRDSEPVVASERRAPHIVTVTVPGLRAEVVVNALSERGVCVSSGSACHSRRSLRSHVLTALGVADDVEVIRLSLGRLSSDDEISRGAELIESTLKGLR